MILFLFSLSIQVVHAHPGRLDSNGGHNDYINGGYHYHTGSSETVQDAPSESISGGYILLYLFLSFVVLFLCFFVIYRCRVSLDIADSSNHRTPAQHRTAKDFNDLLELHRSDDRPLFRPNPIDKSTPMPDYIRSATLKMATPHYIPTFLWECVDILEYTTGYHLPIYSKAYIWAAYFYVFAKTVRSQSVVDELYSRQHKDAMAYFKGRTAGIEPYITLSNAYKKIAPVLNESRIDPRTPGGRDQLWDLLCQWVHFPEDCVESGRKKFRLDCSTIRFYVLKIYGVDYPASPCQSIVDSPGDSEMPTE